MSGRTRTDKRCMYVPQSFLERRMQHTQILRLPAVLERTGLGRSTMFAKIAANEFPRQIKLGLRASGWIAEEVDAWIQQRMAASRPTEGGAK
jgi:prophage regulatory protein